MSTTTWKKRAIPQATRREVALRAGHDGTPGTTHQAHCYYCGAPGVIHWMTRAWVYFKDLELDHIISEYLGGGNGPDNIVLACQWCNRSKGWRRSAREMMRGRETP